jgi:hypothetical protein
MTMSVLSVLNVGKGDFRTELDPDGDPEKFVRDKEMIQRMLRDGYVIAVELPDGTTKQVKRFDKTKNVYIVQGTPKDAPTEVPVREPKKVRAVARSAGGCDRRWV